MFELLKGLALRFAKVPPEPHAPAGSPGSIRIFRAAPNYWRYLVAVWGLRQAAGVFALVAFHAMTTTWQAANGASFDPHGKSITPGAVHTIELVGLALFLLQAPFSLAAARLNFELRWYIVTDRSLRIREGIVSVREMTLTFANVQNIAIRQGPLQRLLGIADVVVRTAGGGGPAGGRGRESEGIGATMHTGTLRAVDNAEQVRDLILERLHRLRDAGLGDPDDRHTAVDAGAASVRDACAELLAAARALRT